MAKLETVEFGRGVAATAVVGFHVNVAAGSLGLAHGAWLGPLQFGVDFFFVLSGFIIVHVHREDLGQSGQAWPYAKKRFVRLYPLLWLVAGSWMALRAGFAAGPSVDEIGTSLLLYPSLTEPVPLVVWTLRHEILFYLAFGVAILNRRAGIALFGAWALGTVYQMACIAGGRPLEGIPSLVLSSFVLDFMLGALVALFAQRHLWRSWWPLIAGTAAVLTFAVLWVAFGWSRADTLDYRTAANLLVPVNGLAFAVLLYGLLCIEDQVRVPRALVTLGGASYAIYLVHVPVIAIVQRIGGKLGNGAGHVFIFAAAMTAGIAIHLLLERRMTRALRARFLG